LLQSSCLGLTGGFASWAGQERHAGVAAAIGCEGGLNEATGSGRCGLEPEEAEFLLGEELAETGV